MEDGLVDFVVWVGLGRAWVGSFGVRVRKGGGSQIWVIQLKVFLFVIFSLVIVESRGVGRGSPITMLILS